MLLMILYNNKSKMGANPRPEIKKFKEAKGFMFFILVVQA